MKKILVVILLCVSIGGTVTAMDRWETVWLETRIWNDLEKYPVPVGLTETAFEDTYGEKRMYGGERPHYGTDIMDVENCSHRLAVCSMTDGVVTRMGWNEYGGWRVGITSQNGIYYYYAHLASYREGLEVGDTVCAGDMLGWMGDSGYGPEGTTGMFPVHLHVGILNNPRGEGDQWVNPYPYLLYLYNVGI